MPNTLAKNSDQTLILQQLKWQNIRVMTELKQGASRYTCTYT
jgi:hypothetical protein